MSTHFEDVQEFHRKFKIHQEFGLPEFPTSGEATRKTMIEAGYPRLINHMREVLQNLQKLNNSKPNVRILRLTLLLEEFTEYTEGEFNNNLVEVADALGDLGVIGEGTCDLYGIPYDAVRKEIHRGNMSKLDENGEPIIRGDGKILKGPNYVAPDIGSILGAQHDNWVAPTTG